MPRKPKVSSAVSNAAAKSGKTRDEKRLLNLATGSGNHLCQSSVRAVQGGSSAAVGQQEVEGPAKVSGLFKWSDPRLGFRARVRAR